MSGGELAGDGDDLLQIGRRVAIGFAVPFSRADPCPLRTVLALLGVRVAFEGVADVEREGGVLYRWRLPPDIVDCLGTAELSEVEGLPAGADVGAIES